MRLIATDHFDPEGEERLSALLAKIEPRLISIEAPEDLTLDHLLKSYEGAYQLALEKAQSTEPACVRAVYPEYIRTYGGEVRAVHKYLQTHPAQVICVDLPKPDLASDALSQGIFMATSLKFVDFLSAFLTVTDMEPKDLAHASAEDLRHALRTTFGRDAYDLARETPAYGYADGRDTHMARRLRALRPDVHICGARHAYFHGPPPLLHELLPDLITERIPLDWAAEYRSGDPRFQYIGTNGNGHKP